MKYEDKIFAVIIGIIYAIIIFINIITADWEPLRISHNVTNSTNYVPMIYIQLMQ